MSNIPHYLIVGLGNITHPATRHRCITHSSQHHELTCFFTSVGHLIIDSLAARFGVRMDFDRAIFCWEGSKELDVSLSAPVRGNASPLRARFTFIKPSMVSHNFQKNAPDIRSETLMNISGPAVAHSLRKHVRPSSPSQLIVIHDSLSHRPLHVSPKAGGSAEGHNGVRSIIQALGGNTAFRRIRVGIGKGNGHVSTYVLGRLSEEERGHWAVRGLDDVWKEVEAIITKR